MSNVITNNFYMKLSIVTKYYANPIFEVKQLIKEGRKKGIEVEVFNLHSPDEVKQRDWGDIIFWRCSSMGAGSNKTWSFRYIIGKGKFIFNPSLTKLPLTSYKDFQQRFFSHKYPSLVNTIKTHQCKNEREFQRLVKKGELMFPLVVKPKFGSQGVGVQVWESEQTADKLVKKIDYSRAIFQNFIPNDGDFRIFVLGGKALGAIMRKAQKGGRINNISQGGHASLVQDPKLKKKLFKLAEFVAAKLELSICGVDIIKDKNSQKLYFLEVNTAPEWKGFQKATKINVAKTIIETALKLKRKKK